MTFGEEIFVWKAIRNYRRWCRENSLIFQQPSMASSANDKVVILRNCNGTLAEYEILPKTARLRRKVAAGDSKIPSEES